MYKEYFGFSALPFSIAPDPNYLFLSEQHKEALAHLIYGVGEQGGFVLLSGEVGTGKTTICRAFLHQIPEHCELAYVVNPKQSETELLKSVCDEFGIYYFWENQGSNYLVDLINEHLLSLHSQGKSAVLIIDEAQNLSADVLEQLRLLTNLETDEKKLLQLILLGQPELNDLLAREELRQLAQRITARFHLRALSEAETRAYILHRLKIAGFHGLLFGEDALSKIFKASGGIPRLINVICDRCLLGVYSTGGNLVDDAICQKAIEEVVGRVSLRRWRFPFRLTAAALLTVACAALFVHHTGKEAATINPSSTVLIDQAPSNSLSPEDKVVATDEHAALLHKLARAEGFTKQYSSNVGSDCSVFEEQELYCQQGQGDAAELMNLGTSVVAYIDKNDATDIEGWVILRGTPGTRFTVEFPDGRVEQRSPATLASVWPVSYTWLWRQPEGYRSTVSLGERDPFVNWLRGRLDQSESNQHEAFRDSLPSIDRVSYLLANDDNLDALNMSKPVDAALLRTINKAKLSVELTEPGLSPRFVQSLRSRHLRRIAG